MEVNKLIGRDFVVGFFVPAVLMVAALAGVLHAFGILPPWLKIDPTEPLKESTFLALVTTVAAFFLMAGNRLIFRALESYWLLGLWRRLNYFQVLRFRRLENRIRRLDAEFTQCLADNKPFTKQQQRNDLMRRAAQRFPGTESQLLATSFGNAVRAFEDYPRVMYGFESINGWTRLNAVLPKSFQEILGNKRAMTDFWVNVWFVCLLAIAEYFFVAMKTGRAFVYIWIPTASALVALFAAIHARIAAELWGEWVKAAFDVYLPDLRVKLGLQPQPTAEVERLMWKTVSQASLYRDVGSLQRLDAFRGQTDCHQESKGVKEEDETDSSDE